MRRGRSQGTGISYFAEGNPAAPLVVCLHGFPDTPHTWAPMAEHLCKGGYRVVLPWLPGYAPSSLEGPFDIPSLAVRMSVFLDELSPNAPLNLVGHDFGAIIAQVLLATSPKRFSAAAVLAIPHLLGVEKNIRSLKQVRRSAYIGMFQVPFFSERIVRARDFRYVERLWRLWSPGFDAPQAHMQEVKRCLRASMPAPLMYYRTLRRRSNVEALRSLLHGGPITVPTLYMHGERDGCMGPEMGDGQAEFFGGGFESIVLPEAGHFLNLEQPATVARHIARWFESEHSVQ